MKNSKLIITALLIFLSLYADDRYKFTYKINSIDEVLANAHGEEKIEVLLNLSGFYIDKYNDITKGIGLLLQARDLSLELNNSEGLIKSYRALGDIYKVTDNSSQALDYYGKQAQVQKLIGKDRDLVATYLRMSDVSLEAKNFDRSVFYINMAISDAEKLKDNDLLAQSYYYITLAYRGKFEYEKALEFTYKALELSEKTENKYLSGNCYNAIGDLNEMMGNFDTAFENYQKAEKIYEEFNVPSGLAIAYFNLASMYKVKGDYIKSLDYMNKSLNLSLELNSEYMIKENYMGLYGMFNLLKDFKNANKYYMLYNSYSAQNDSINAPITKIEIDYEISKNEMNKELLNLKLKQEKNIRYIYAGVFSLLLAVTYFLFYRKLKQKKINELKLDEKRVRAELSSLQSKINPHFLFNAISSISELINFDPDSAKKMLQNISGLLRYTLRTSKNEFVQLEEEIMMVRKYLEIEKIRFGKRLEYTIDIPDTLSNMLVPPLLIQPLVENSIKHGLSNRLEGGKVSISAYEKIPGKVTIVVEDNGVSKDDGTKPEGNGIGLSSVKDRLHLVYNGDHSFKIEKENGFTVMMTIPKKI